MNQDSADNVLNMVNEQEIVRLASALVEIPSFKLEETPVALFLESWFKERGFQVELQEVEPGRFQTVATLKGTGGGHSLMLNGHIDINALTRGWRRDPWKPSVEGDRLYGHGIANMKGGLTSVIMAGEVIRRSGIRLKGDLVIACVLGETQGGEGTHYLMRRGPKPDMAVVAEPFGLGNLATVHAGIVHLAVHVYGIAGHMMFPGPAVNAIHKMARTIEALQNIEFTYTPSAHLPALPRMNIGGIIGGRGESYVLVEPPYVPDLCTAIIDVHFLPGMTVDGILADIRRVLDSLREQDPDFKYEIEVPPPDFFRGRRKLVMSPLDVPTDEYIVRSVARAHELVMGEPPKAIGTILPKSYRVIS